MNLLRLSSIAFAVALVAAGCGSNQGPTSDGADSAQVTIANFPLSLDIKSASQSYKITDSKSDMTYYLTVSSKIQWPETIGQLDIKELQDTIQRALYGTVNEGGVDAAMIAFVSDAERYGIGDKIERVDTVPAANVSNNIFYNQADATLAEVSEELVTFNVYYEQFMGGAHPMYGARPFTYDFATKSVITPQWLFVDGSEQEVRQAIKEAIAAQVGLTMAELDETLWTPNINISPTVYVEDGQIVFHYNPYDILPYSYGSIDATIAPWTLHRVLTPEAKALFKGEI